MMSTFPTGKELLPCTEMPSSDPATAMCISGESSQKYFNAVRACGQFCISSRMSKVSPAVMSIEASADSFCSKLLVGPPCSNIEQASLSRSSENMTVCLYSFLPNSVKSQVFPTCLAPLRIKGLRFGLFFHSISLLYSSLFILLTFLCTNNCQCDTLLCTNNCRKDTLLCTNNQIFQSFCIAKNFVTI